MPTLETESVRGADFGRMAEPTRGCSGGRMMCSTQAMPCNKCDKPVLRQKDVIYRPEQGKALCRECCVLLELIPHWMARR